MNFTKRNPRSTFLTLILALSALSWPLMLRAQSDDFDDGDDLFPVAWTEYDAINTLSGGTTGPQDTWSFTNGGYRFEAIPSPAPGSYGPARVSSFPPNVYTNFYVSVDLMGWATNYSQAFGVLARVGDFSTAGAPTTRGYGFIYVSGAISASALGYDNFIAIFRLRNDASTSGVHGSGTNVAEVHGVNLDPAKQYRLVFVGEGTHMEGRVYDLANLDQPVAIVSANSAGESTMHTDGQSGLLAFNVADAGGAPYSGPVDVTFDNYLAAANPQIIRGENPPLVTDNFNDGDDAGWTHYPDPPTLAQTWSVPTNAASAGNYAYRMTSVFGTSGANYGRVLSSRNNDVDYADFCIQADLVNWDQTQSQQMGIVARLQTPAGYQASAVPSCYMLAYLNRFSSGNGGTDQLRLLEISPSVGIRFLHQGDGSLGQFGKVSGASLPPDPSKHYRLLFRGNVSGLTGQIIDVSTGEPLTFNLDGSNSRMTNMVSTTWATNFTTGKVGLGIFQNNASSPDATFDDFIAAVASPSVTITRTGGQIKISWPAQQQGIWVLESNPTLDSSASWTEITAEKIAYSNGQNTHTVSNATGTSFYRLRKV